VYELVTNLKVGGKLLMIKNVPPWLRYLEGMTIVVEKGNKLL
jgi:hypothetical protein